MGWNGRQALPPLAHTDADRPAAPGPRPHRAAHRTVQPIRPDEEQGPEFAAVGLGRHPSALDCKGPQPPHTHRCAALQPPAERAVESIAPNAMPVAPPGKVADGAKVPTLPADPGKGGTADLAQDAVNTKSLQGVDPVGHEAFAAHFVAHVIVQHKNVATAGREAESRGDADRTGANDQNLGVHHTPPPC